MQKSNFKFKNPKLIHLDFKINQEYHGKDILTLDIKDEVIIKNINETSALVTLILKIFSEEDFNDVPFIISIEMQGDFSWSSDMDDNIVKVLLKQNAPAALLSYMRPYITTITTGGGYPPLVLPFMSFVEN